MSPSPTNGSPVTFLIRSMPTRRPGWIAKRTHTFEHDYRRTIFALFTKGGARLPAGASPCRATLKRLRSCNLSWSPSTSAAPLRRHYSSRSAQNEIYLDQAAASARSRASSNPIRLPVLPPPFRSVYWLGLVSHWCLRMVVIRWVWTASGQYHETEIDGETHVLLPSLCFFPYSIHAWHRMPVEFWAAGPGHACP